MTLFRKKFLAVCLLLFACLFQAVEGVSAERVLRLVPSPGVMDYSEEITRKLQELRDNGGGTLLIAPGRYPILQGVVLAQGTKAVTLTLRGEKDARGRVPVLFDTDINRDPHHFFLFEGEALSPSLALSFFDLEIRGNNIPRNPASANTPFVLDEGQTDLEPNLNLPRNQSYGHPFFFRGDIYSAAIRAKNVKSLHVEGVVIRNLFGNGIVVANYGNKHWERIHRVQNVTIKNCKLDNVWQWHQYDNTGDAIMLWNVADGVIENNEIVNDLAHTRWVGRCGIVLETNTEGIVVKNNVISGYARNIHIELTFGGHQIIDNKLLASDIGITLNEPDGATRTPEVLNTTRPVTIEGNTFHYSQERERYGVHSFGGPRSFISISTPRSAALDGSRLVNNKFTYKTHKGVRLNPWRAYDISHKTRHIYVQNSFLLNNWVEEKNTFR